VIGLALGVVHGQIVTGGKAPARAAQDAHSHIQVSVRFFEGVQNFGAELIIQRVAFVWTVEGNAPDQRLRVIDQNEFVTHSVLVLLIVLWRSLFPASHTRLRFRRVPLRARQESVCPQSIRASDVIARGIVVGKSEAHKKSFGRAVDS
jgi:hypothetical protein